ncbi:14 kDa phosphohistidine phosphatase-like [Limulus polyphemus]|uniref:14 kDa phosphohistidine phosphatase-like n=1 Tax=Limulus polyphemus TaxID=6850 RepID=A0ABM1RUH7_LIMPO|nr:14 kDa phosphohistidine phosphatase-like [Limulus polyphemus]
MVEKLDDVPDVEIDTGRFKYILVKVFPKRHQESHKYIVRGNRNAAYHGDILDDVEPQVSKLKLECDCVGGGRIIHDPEAKRLEVFGYSQGYGKADHAVTCEILKKKYPAYHITWSDCGY